MEKEIEKKLLITAREVKNIARMLDNIEKKADKKILDEFYSAADGSNKREELVDSLHIVQEALWDVILDIVY